LLTRNYGMSNIHAMVIAVEEALLYFLDSQAESSLDCPCLGYEIFIIKLAELQKSLSKKRCETTCAAEATGTGRSSCSWEGRKALPKNFPKTIKGNGSPKC